LKQFYADGSRDICVSAGIDENGKLRYHQVTEKEEKMITEKEIQKL
jgi:hypothetical protein